MTYHNRYNSPYYWEPEDTWEHWNKLADSYSRHRSDEEIKDFDQHFFDNYVGFNGRDRDVSTIAGERSRRHMSDPSHANLYNKQGTWIDKNNWDGWTLQSASMIWDPNPGRRWGRLPFGGSSYLATAWTQNDSKTVYVGLHHWGSLDPDGNKIPNGTHIKDLGYFEPTDKRYEGVERWFKYDFNGDEIVNGKAWSEPEGGRYGVRRIGGTPSPTRSPRQAPSRDELEPIGLESTDMNSSLDDELTRMMFPGASYEPITAVEALF